MGTFQCTDDLQVMSKPYLMTSGVLASSVFLSSRSLMNRGNLQELESIMREYRQM